MVLAGTGGSAGSPGFGACARASFPCVAGISLAAARIRVNTVAPGAILTPRLLDMTTSERRAESAASIPLGRLGEPEEVAKAVVFLASDLASYVTGQTLVVDGGASVKFPLSLRSNP